MLFVTDKIIELGGVVIPGMVKDIEITETATIDEAKDDDGKLKAVQPLGYETGKVNISVVLEDMEGKSTLEQLMEIQRLFKPYGANSPNLLPIVSEDCGARGIGAVHVKSVTSKKVTDESRRTVVIECIAPEVVGIQVETVPGSVAGAVEAAGAAAVAAAAVPKKNESNTSKKSKKDKNKSPAKDSQNTYTHRINAQSLAQAQRDRENAKSRRG